MVHTFSPSSQEPGRSLWQPVPEEQQMALKLMESSPPISTKTVGPEASVLPRTITLLPGLSVLTAVLVYELYGNSQGPSSPSLGTVIAGTIIMTDLFQALLLEQMNGSSTTLRKD